MAARGGDEPGRDVRSRTGGERLLRSSKIRTLAALRLARWTLRPADYPRPLLAPPPESFPEVIYQQNHALVRAGQPFHARLEEGKRLNLSLAAPAFDGLLLTPERPLSFWRVVGRLTRARGYVPGASFEDGCVVPAIGGGVCLLSNALFGMAARLGWAILERHGHTLDAAQPPVDGPWGLDATVFWPYVDLRVAPREGSARLEVEMHGDALRVAVRSTVPLRGRFALDSVDERIDARGPEQVHENRIRRTHLSDGAAPTGEVIAVNRKRVRGGVLEGRSCLDCGEEHCPVGRRVRAGAG